MIALSPMHDAERLELLIAEVARRFGISAAQVRARDRSKQVAVGRHVTFWALTRVGLNVSQIARLLDLNHSTVVHGLARVERHPEWQALALPALELSGVGGQRQALRRWIARGVRDLPGAERRAVHAYATCTLLGWERHAGSTCAYGLMLVQRRPQLRAALEEALRRCELGAEVWRIELQVARLARSS